MATFSPTNSSVVPKKTTFTSKNSSVVPTTPAPAKVQPKPQGSSVGSYKGVAIRPGTDAEVAEQVATIDRGGNLGVRAKMPEQNIKVPSPTLPKNQKVPEPPKPLYAQLIEDLQKRGKEGDRAIGKAASDLTAFRQGTSQKIADIKSDPIPLEFQQGRAQVVQQASAEKEAAMSQGIQNLIQARGQDLTALQQAAALAAPIQVAPGTTAYSPVTGDSVAGGLGGYTDYQAAQNFFGLQSQYPDAKIQYNPALTPQQNLQNAQQVLSSSPTYQKSTYGVPGQQSIAGATSVNANVAGYTDAYQNYQNLTSQLSYAEGNADNLLNIMQTAGINPQDARFVSKPINDIKRQLSSPQQQAFDVALKETQGAFASILFQGGGTVPTETTNAYNILLNPNASLGAVNAAIEQLKRAGQLRLQSVGSQVNTYASNLPGNGSSGGSGTIQAGGYTFVKDASGNWVPAR